MAKKGGLGKGLDALFQDNETEINGSLMSLRISDVEPNKNQPRRYFDIEALQELSDSIKEHGMIQPIVVRAIPGGAYQIIAGERRWRASRMADLSEIPALIIDADANKMLEIGLIENLQRKDLSSVEEAMGYRSLMNQFSMTQEEVAKKVGKSRPVVTNALRLLTLPQRAIEALENGGISAGHARVLAGIENEDKLNNILDKVILDRLSVRELEELSKKEHDIKAKKSKKEDSTWGEAWYKEIEVSLRDVLGRKVKVKKKGKMGSIEIQFYSKEELQDIAKKLAKE